jgi:hypothetical protein
MNTATCMDFGRLISNRQQINKVDRAPQTGALLLLLIMGEAGRSFTDLQTEAGSYHGGGWQLAVAI